MNIWDWLRNFIQSRGAQLITRYLQAGLVSLATYLGIKYNSDALAQLVAFATPMIVAGLLHWLDTWQRKQQTLDVQARAIHEGADRVVDAVQLIQANSYVPVTKSVSFRDVTAPSQAPLTVVKQAAAQVKAETQILTKT